MLKNVAIAALLNQVPAVKVDQKNENGEEFPIIVLSRHQPINAPIIEVAPSQGQPGSFITSMEPSSSMGQPHIIAIEAIPMHQPQYQSQIGQPSYHSQTDAASQSGVKVTNVRTYDDPNFATKETTSKVVDGKVYVKECIGGNCKEHVEQQAGAHEKKHQGTSDMITRFQDHQSANNQATDDANKANDANIADALKAESAQEAKKEDDAAQAVALKKFKTKAHSVEAEKAKKEKQPMTEQLVKSAVKKLNTNNEVKVQNFDKMKDDPANHLYVPKKDDIESYHKELQQANSTKNATLAKKDEKEKKSTYGSEAYNKQLQQADSAENATANANITASANSTKQALVQDPTLVKQEKKETSEIASEENQSESKKPKNSQDNLKNYGKMKPTNGKIELNQQQTETDEELDAEVYAGEKSKEVADIEKAQRKIMLMQQQVIQEQQKVDQKMRHMLERK